MNSKQRALKKELLLLKGEAMRTQLQVERSLMHRQLSLTGLACNLLNVGGYVLSSLQRRQGKTWRTWFKIATQTTLLWTVLQHFCRRR